MSTFSHIYSLFLSVCIGRLFFGQNHLKKKKKTFRAHRWNILWLGTSYCVTQALIIPFSWLAASSFKAVLPGPPHCAYFPLQLAGGHVVYQQVPPRWVLVVSSLALTSPDAGNRMTHCCCIRVQVSLQNCACRTLAFTREVNAASKGKCAISLSHRPCGKSLLPCLTSLLPQSASLTGRKIISV